MKSHPRKRKARKPRDLYLKHAWITAIVSENGGLLNYGWPPIKIGERYLNRKEARRLAAWLIRASEYLEGRGK